MDIMAYIDDEPEGISFIQKDARLAGGPNRPGDREKEPLGIGHFHIIHHSDIIC